IGREHVMYIHCTLVPYIKAAGEVKTKPTQHSVKELRSLGIQPDAIVLRSELPISEEMKENIALFCDNSKQMLIELLDADTSYQVTIALQKQRLDQLTCDHLGLNCSEAAMQEWEQLIASVRNLSKTTVIGLVGKYVELPDAYLSVVESLKHAGFSYDTDVQVKWINSEKLSYESIVSELEDVDGVLVPGGFGDRGIDGKIEAIRYARKNKKPFFGICLGMQLATVEFARNVLGLENAHSAEIDPATPNPIIDLLPEQKNISDLGGTLRLGSYPCKLMDGTKTKQAYGNEDLIYERHRHRYEFNNNYREQVQDNGMILSGTSPDDRLVETIELADHPWFVACQFHPEFKSRPNRPQSLFHGFIRAACRDC